MLATRKLLKTTWCPIKSAVRRYPYPVSFRYYLQNLTPVQYSRTCNGVTVATEARDSYNACVGLFMDGGSRYESDFENGMAHFFEHIAFKGTNARNRAVLEEQMACVGARFNCFTTRDMAVYYAECLCQDVPIVTDILTDCVYNNSFSIPEIECQKKAVYSEMLEYDNDPDTLVKDYLHSTAFQGTPLAKTVMGPSTNLSGFTNVNLYNYTRKYFDPRRTVLAAVGGVTQEQMFNLAELYLSKLDTVKCLDMDPYRYTGSEVRFRLDTLPRANVIMAVEGPCLSASENIVMEVAKALIGGWDHRQPCGDAHATPLVRKIASPEICDSYKAFNVNYKDTGLWGVHFIANKLYIEEIVYFIQSEWMYLCNCVTNAEVERARREVKMKWLSKMENITDSCLDLGRWVLYNGQRMSLLESICGLDCVTAQDIQEVCTKYLYDRCPVVAAVGPTEALPEYNRIRSGMHWLRT